MCEISCFVKIPGYVINYANGHLKVLKHISAPKPENWLLHKMTRQNVNSRIIYTVTTITKYPDHFVKYIDVVIFIAYPLMYKVAKPDIYAPVNL